MNKHKVNWRTRIAWVLNRALVPLGFVSYADPVTRWEETRCAVTGCFGFKPVHEGWRFKVVRLAQQAKP
jgi:hypothetical protein